MRIDSIYKKLRSLPPAEVDRSLVAAVPRAGRAALRAMADLLLGRGNTDALATLLTHMDRLSPDQRRRLTELSLKLHHPLRQAARRGGGAGAAGAANVLGIIEQAGACELGDLAVDILCHGRGPERAQAAQTLGVLATGAVRRGDALAAAQVADALAAAVRQYAHHLQPPVLDAASTLPTGMIRALFQPLDPRHAAIQALNEAIRTGSSPVIRRRLLLWTAIGSTAHAAAQACRTIVDRGRGGHFLHDAHLTILPAVRQALGRHVDGQVMIASLSRDGQAASTAMVMIVSSLNVPLRARVEALAAMSQASDRMARLAAVRRLLALQCAAEPGALTAALLRFCRDDDARIASLACRAAVSGAAGAAQWRELAALAESPHAQVRAIVGRRLGPLGFERLWRAWRGLSVADRRSAAAALIKLDPAFHERLARRLTSAQQPSRLRALAMIHQLNQGPLFESVLIELARGRDDALAASAVRTLGGVDSQYAREVAEASLAHRDPRVRANAVEALAQMSSIPRRQTEGQSRRHLPKLEAMGRADANRPRANALGELLRIKGRSATGGVRSMLAEPSHDHRMSALWLVAQMGLADVAATVGELAVSDGDDDIRRRAQRAVGELIETMRRRPTAADAAAPESTAEAAL